MNREQVLHVARLARLSFTEDELEEMARGMNAILAYIDLLKRVDTAAVAPMAHATAPANVFREDEPAPSLSPEEWLQAAPWRSGPFAGVPRFVEE